MLARYPLPNNPLGSYGVHTYASSSPVVTDADQFSVRLDHRISDRSQLFARFNFNNLNGPTTNPDQTVIDPALAFATSIASAILSLTYTRTVSPRLISESSVSVTRATPSFPTTDLTDPAVKFNDGLYEPFNQPAGTVISVYGNLFQGRQNLSFTTGSHAFKAGAEVRLNRDTTYFGISPDGEYDFGGGTAYSPVNISSQSGMHNIRVGDPLPDTLSGLLSGSPFVYTVVVAPPYFSGGEHIGAAAINRNAFRLLCPGHLEDLTSPGARLRSALRAVHARFRAREKDLGDCFFHDAHRGCAAVRHQSAAWLSLQPRTAWDHGCNWIGWPATRSMYAPAARSRPSRLIYSRTTRSPGRLHSPSIPASPRLRAGPIPYGFQITSNELPRVYTPDGQDIFANGTKAVHANTVMDLNRYQQDLAALSPSHRITPLSHQFCLSRLWQRLSSDLDSGPGAPFRRLGRRRDLHRNRSCQATPG